MFKTIPRSLVVETIGRVWVLGGSEDGRVQVPKWEELPMGRCSLLFGLRSSFQCLDQIALLLREFGEYHDGLGGDEVNVICIRGGCLLTNGGVGHLS